jgi:ankyrin repeat protein
MASAQVPDFTPPTPLLGAVLPNNTTEAKRRLAEGADPNQGRMIGSPATFQALVENGADVQARDDSGSTALLWAAFNEVGGPALGGELPRLGAGAEFGNRGEE